MRIVGPLRRLGRRVRLLVVLKNTSNFAKNPFFLFAGLGGTAIGRRLSLLRPQPEDPRKYALYPAALIAGAGRFRTDDEGGTVSLWARRGCQKVRDFVEL